jgi:hypothetical protein
MRARHFSRYFFGAVLILAGLATASGGCSRQTEGERCDDLTGDTDDCDAGLVCTACERLRTLDVDRCCPPAGSDYSDPRCAPTSSGTCSLNPTGGGGEGGSPAGEGATSSGAAANEGGTGGEVASGSGGIPGVSGAGGESGAPPSTSGTSGAGGESGAAPSTGGAAAGEGGTESTSAGSGGA